MQGVAMLHLIQTAPDISYIRQPKPCPFLLQTQPPFKNPTPFPMASAMAAKISRSMNTVRSSCRTLSGVRATSPLSSPSKRFISSLQRPHPLPARFRPAIPLSSMLNQVRFRVNRAHNDYSPQGPSSGGQPHSEMSPLFPGCDYMHWLIVMDNPGGPGATKQQMIDCYVKTLAQVVGR